MNPGIQTSKSSDIRFDYMTLLVTQLQNQNPLEPMSNSDMTAQLTQISQLEQLENLGKNFDKVLDSMQQSYSGSLLGKNVTFDMDDGAGGSVRKTAVVDEILTDQSNGEISLRVLEGTGGEKTEFHNDPYTGKSYLTLVKSDPIEHTVKLDDVTIVDNDGASLMSMRSNANRQFASSLVGRKVQFNKLVDPATGEIEELTGTASSVQTNPYTGTNTLTVQVGHEKHTVELDSIRGITY